MSNSSMSLLAPARLPDTPGVAIVGHRSPCRVPEGFDLVGRWDPPDPTRGRNGVATVDEFVDRGVRIFVVDLGAPGQAELIEQIEQVATRAGRPTVMALAGEGASTAAALDRLEELHYKGVRLLPARAFAWQAPRAAMASCLRKIGGATSVSVTRMHRLRPETVGRSPAPLAAAPLEWLYGALNATAVDDDLEAWLHTSNAGLEFGATATLRTEDAGEVHLEVVTGYADECPFDVRLQGPDGTLSVGYHDRRLVATLELGRERSGYEFSTQTLAWERMFAETSTLLAPVPAGRARQRRARLARRRIERERLIAKVTRALDFDGAAT